VIIGIERARGTGIEPAFSAWEADVLPLNYTRAGEGIVAAVSPDAQASARLSCAAMGTAGAPGPAGAADAIVDEAMRDLVRRTGDGEVTVGAALGATAALRDAADRKLFVLVGFARDAGASWAAIGEALGVTTQAAHQRFGRKTSSKTASSAS